MQQLIATVDRLDCTSYAPIGEAELTFGQDNQGRNVLDIHWTGGKNQYAHRVCIALDEEVNLHLAAMSVAIVGRGQDND